MTEVAITGSGVFVPEETISNSELVASYNRYVHKHNHQHAGEIASGVMHPLKESSEEYIKKTSGILRRHVMDKSGILDPERMCPRLEEHYPDGSSIQGMMGLQAAKAALRQAERSPDQVDAIIVACTGVQRLYPAIAIEIQQALGVTGFAFDMQAACASMLFGIQTAVDAISNGRAKCALVISPEICTARTQFRDRKSHFLFGDAAAAVVIEKTQNSSRPNRFEILDIKSLTQYSDAIYNHFGLLLRTSSESDDAHGQDRLFNQQGTKVVKEIVPLVSRFIREQLDHYGIPVADLKRLWLHQANIRIIQMIGAKVFGRTTTRAEIPLILDEYGNTSSAGVAIAYHMHRDDLAAGDIAVMCAFGAGYTIGMAILRKG